MSFTTWVDERVKAAVDEAVDRAKVDLQAEITSIKDDLKSEISSAIGELKQDVRGDIEGIPALVTAGVVGEIGKIELAITSLSSELPQQIISAVSGMVPHLFGGKMKGEQQ